MVQSSLSAAPSAISGGTVGNVENLKPWKPGQSGNPSGRPKGIARTVRERCGGDPGQLVDILLGIAEDTGQKASDRTAAARALIEHGWGKAPAFAAIEGGDPLEQSDLDRAIGAIADELAGRRNAKEPPESGSSQATTG